MAMPLIVSRTITADDIARCARLTGDYGSHHISGMAGRQMAQGLLTLAAAPLLGDPGVHIAEMSVRFLLPVFAGDTVTATVEITDRTELASGQVACTCSVTVTNADSAQVMVGTAVAHVPAVVAGTLAGAR